MDMLKAILIAVVAYSITPSAFAGPADEINAADKAFDGKQYQEAIKLYTKAIASSAVSNADRAYALIQRGIAHTDLKAFDRAIADFTEAIRLIPTAGAAYCERGTARAYSGDLDGALADYASAIRVDSNHKHALYQRIDVRSAKGDFDGVIADYNELLRQDPKNAEILRRRGLVWYYEKRDFDRAISDLSEAIKLAPTVEIYFLRGQVWMHKDDPDRAIADFDEVIRHTDYYNVAYAHANRGEMWLWKKEYARAVADFTAMIGLQPQEHYGYSARCKAHALNGSFSQAKVDCDEALRRKPSDIDALNGRGLIALKSRDYAKAISDYSVAAKHHPKSAEALYGRGMARWLSNDQAGGRADMSAAKAFVPGIVERFKVYGYPPIG